MILTKPDLRPRFTDLHTLDSYVEVDGKAGKNQFCGKLYGYPGL